MSRIFGWSLPPGVTNRMIDDAAGGDGHCDVCGQDPDDCICPECPVCQSVGDLKCYAEHGMIRTAEQIASRAAADKYLADQAQLEQYWDEQIALEEKEGNDGR